MLLIEHQAYDGLPR